MGILNDRGLQLGKQPEEREEVWALASLSRYRTAAHMVPRRALVSFVSCWLWRYRGVIWSISGRSAAVRENNE